MELENNNKEEITIFPDDYEDMKDSYLDFIETAFLIDIKMQSITEVADKIDKATDKFAKYLLDFKKRN